MVTSTWQKVGREREEIIGIKTQMGGKSFCYIVIQDRCSGEQLIIHFKATTRAGFQGSQHTEMILLTEPETVIILIKSLHTAHMDSVITLSTNK